MTGTIGLWVLIVHYGWLIYIWVSKRASRCVWRLCCCLVKSSHRYFCFPLHCALLQLHREEGWTSVVGKMGLKIECVNYDLGNLKVCNSLVFYYLLNFNLLIWNIIAVLKFLLSLSRCFNPEERTKQTEFSGYKYRRASWKYVLCPWCEDSVTFNSPTFIFLLHKNWGLFLAALIKLSLILR